MNVIVLLIVICLDRYVVLSASGEGVGIVLELAKILNRIQGEHRWKPRRSIIFCLFSGYSNPCSEILSTFMRHKVIAYVVIHHQALQGLYIPEMCKEIFNFSYNLINYRKRSVYCIWI